MKTLICGDIHNKFGYLNTLINRKNPDLIICCGDFGYWPNADWAAPLSNIKLNEYQKLLWCDGNHEDHWALRDRVTDELEPNIIYMPRGSTCKLPDGRNILFMGGADSIDKEHRIRGNTWFPEEVIHQSDMMDLPDKKIDIFVTHTCPNELVLDLVKFYPEKTFEPSNHALSELWKIYKPDLWFFGHWHHYKEGRLIDGITKWYALSAPGFDGRWWMWLPDKQ